MRRFPAHACVLCRFWSLFVRTVYQSFSSCVFPATRGQQKLSAAVLFPAKLCGRRPLCELHSAIGVVTEPQHSQRVNTLCVDLDFVHAHFIFASQAWHDLGHKGCLGMDALVTVCSWNRNVIMAWAWMLWSRERW